MALNAEQQQRLVRQCSEQFEAGASVKEATVFCVGEALKADSGVDEVKIAQAVVSIYDYLRQTRKPKRPNREAQAVALYDALLALGWTPPV